VIALTSPYLWYTTRATGIVALCLLTIVMVLGIGTATRAGGRFLLRFEVAEIHRRLSMVAVVFVALHVVTTLLDSYVNVGLIAAVVPFASHYKPLSVALGTVALDLMLAVGISSLFRSRISPSSWRAIHWLSYLCFPIAAVHTIVIGSDMKHGWMDLLVALCMLLVLAAGVWRLAWHRGSMPEGARTVLHPHPRGGSIPAAPRVKPAAARQQRAATDVRQSAPSPSARQRALAPEVRRVATSRRDR
jgi:sulfoxide reductase heme-binding subunit YedZ